MYLEIMFEIFPKAESHSKLARVIGIAVALVVVLATFFAFLFGIGFLLEGRYAGGIILLAVGLISTAAQIVAAICSYKKNEKN